MIRVLPALVVFLLQTVISVRTDLVVVPVTVTDASGHRVPGLSQDDFRIYEDGRLRPVTVFLHGDEPVTLGVIVDRSQSMRSKDVQLRTAVAALLESSRADDQLFGVDFNDDVSLTPKGDRAFIVDPRELTDTLSAVRAEGRTALYDGVGAGLKHLELGHSQKNALIVVSDGGDNASQLTADQVLALAWRSQAVIYGIAVLSLSPSAASEEENPKLLQQLCRDTGGVSYEVRSIADITDVAHRIAQDLRDQYTLGFAPDKRTDAPAFRKIEVRVSAASQGRLHVRTRSGYLATPDKDD